MGFKSAETDPNDPELLRTFSRTLKTEVAMLRSLSGVAAVYTAYLNTEASEIEKRLKKLESIDVVQYAEFDRRRYIQSR